MSEKCIVRIIVLPLLLLLWGCLQSSLTFQVRYAEIEGLQQDDPVYFGKNTIGRVKKVSYTQQGDYLVELNIDADFKNAATTDSQFFIEDDPRGQRGKVVTILQEKSGGKVLEGGAIVQGSVKAGFLDEMMSGLKRNAAVAEQEMRKAMQQLEKSLQGTTQRMDREMRGALDDLSRKFTQLSGEVKKVPERQEVKQLEQAVQQFVDEFNKAQKDVRDQIQKDVMPQFQREIEKLRERLHKEGRDGEIEVIDQHVKKMSV